MEASDLEQPAQAADNKSPAPSLTSSEAAWERLKEADAILVPGGFGQRGVEGMVAAASYARRNGVPYLGICLGMQVRIMAVVLGCKACWSQLVIVSRAQAGACWEALASAAWRAWSLLPAMHGATACPTWASAWACRCGCAAIPAHRFTSHCCCQLLLSEACRQLGVSRRALGTGATRNL